MSDYKKWLRQQPEAFQREILLNTEKPTDKFVDERYRNITLDELKSLDDEFNN